MKITIETNTNAKTPNQKLITPIKPLTNFLSLTPTIAFDNHPSARGLKKDENEENKKSNLNNNIIEKKNSKFKITLDSVDSKLYNILNQLKNKIILQKKKKYLIMILHI